MSRRRLRRVLGFAFASALALVPALAPAPVAAARPDLTIVGAATYDVLPAEGRVAVRVELTATNHLRDSITRRFFFRNGFVTVLPGTSGFRLTGGNGTPKVTVQEQTDTFTNLKLDFGANLAARRSTELTLTFDLRDPGGDPARPVRISPSLITFDAWAVATPETPGASVAVRLPTGLNVTMGRGPLQGPTADAGAEVWTSGELDVPLDFVADVDANRSTEYAETSHGVALANGEAAVVIRSWPDDTAWRDRVASLVERALPILEEDIGLPWPVDGPLTIQEALVRGPEGDAGVFDPAERRLDVAYAATDAAIVHHLAHAWFNGALVADRWAAEGFASYYAELAATELGIVGPQVGEAAGPALEPGPLRLNAWIPGASAEDDAYAYAASLEVARTLARRSGGEALTRTWDLAARGVGAYRPDAETEEPAESPPDWRGLLDLLEESGEEELEDVWRAWVARPEDAAALAARAEARTQYEATLAEAGEWRLPPSIRQAMRSWRFDVAGDQLTAADEVLTQRARLEAAAAAEDLELPSTLRELFEGDAGLAAAAVEASSEQATVDAIAAAVSARPVEPDLVQGALIRIGLLTTDPELDLVAARQELASGDLDVAHADATAAAEAWASAADVGRSRIVSTVLLLVALAVFVSLVRGARRKQSVESTSEVPADA